jgi:hypothetical protein
MSVVARGFLILVVAFLVVRVGVALTARLPHSSSLVHHSSFPVAPSPDWGGGNLSFPSGSAADIVDSVRTASDITTGAGTHPRSLAYSGQGVGVVLRPTGAGHKDYAVTLALPSSREPGRTGLLELPSSDHFRRELFPDSGDAQAPAADIPLYPGSSCRTQVGQGSDYFVGFYLTPDGIEAVRAFYVRALGRLGWQRTPSAPPGFLETFAKPAEGRMVIVQLREQDSATTRIGLVAMTQTSPNRNERK